MDELTIGDKIYISSKRAAEITGYAKDYIGQLCREGRVEATLVGRSWYVLETSIRDHRFGSEGSSVKAKQSIAATDTKDSITSWESPKYEPEEVIEVPQVEKRPINLLESEPAAPAPAPEPVQKAETTVEDMQSAWREWFASRNREKLIESPEVIDARAEDEMPEAQDSLEVSHDDIEESLVHEVEEEVRINRLAAVADRVYDPIPSTPEVEEPVRIHRQATVAYVPPMPPQRPQKGVSRRKGKNYLAVRALLLSLALIAAAVAIIGTGNADSLLGDDARTYEPVKYLGGTRTIE